MKITYLLTSVAAGSLLTLTAQAGIVGSPHDFSSQSWNTDPSDPATVCSTCHTPHHADSSVVPLWSHQTTTAGFKMYSQSTVPISQMVAVPATSPNGPSLACLSCHDGTVAINTYGGAFGGDMTTHGTATYITNGALIGTDLTHSHPISFQYSPSIVGTGPSQDKWLYNPQTTPVLTPVSGTFVPGNNMTIQGFLLNGDSQYSLECGSCHDVHNQIGTPYDVNNNPHLVKIVGVDSSGKGSLLCRSCHNK
ncbi:MAG: hypothetical protein ABSH48_21615 [Verrucomicrobiota bacterium]|jgi:cytochrome c553